MSTIDKESKVNSASLSKLNTLMSPPVMEEQRSCQITPLCSTIHAFINKLASYISVYLCSTSVHAFCMHISSNLSMYSSSIPWDHCCLLFMALWMQGCRAKFDGTTYCIQTANKYPCHGMPYSVIFSRVNEMEEG